MHRDRQRYPEGVEGRAPAKRSRRRVWLIGLLVAHLVAAGVLAGLNAVGWLDLSGGAQSKDGASAVDFAVALPPGWVENLRWGQRLVEQVDPDLVDALVYFAGFAGGGSGYDPTLAVLREPLPPDAGLAEVAEAKFESFRAGAPRADVTRSDARVDGMPAVRIVVTDPPALVSGQRYETAQLLVVRGEEVWALQCEHKTPGPSRRHAEAWEACGEAMEGFRFGQGHSP